MSRSECIGGRKDKEVNEGQSSSVERLGPRQVTRRVTLKPRNKKILLRISTVA